MNSTLQKFINSFLNFSAAIFVSLIFLNSCNLNEVLAEEDNYEIYLPEWPPENFESSSPLPHPSYPELSRWLIKVHTRNYTTEYYTNNRSLVINTDKNSPAAILAYPVTFISHNSSKIENQYFKPAGKILPSNKNENKIFLSWQEGFLAEIFFEAEKCNFPVENFNWNKAQKIIDTKSKSSEEIFYNPWFCNKSRILENIIQGNFRESYLNATGSISLSLEDDIIKDKIQAYLISSYIPENQFIYRKKNITLLKNQKELFISDSNNTFISQSNYFSSHINSNPHYGIIFEWKSKKNISAEIVYLPIFKDEL